jgi:hypothetical protein
MNSNNIHTLVHYFSYWLLHIVIIAIIFNILNYDSYLIYCDSNEPIDEFFIEDNSNESLSNSNYSEDAHCSSILDKYKNIGKRKIAWHILEKDKGNFSSYKEYKKSWDPNTSILSEIRKQVRLDIRETSQNLTTIKDKFSVAKRTLHWFFGNSKPGGGRF